MHKCVQSWTSPNSTMCTVYTIFKFDRDHGATLRLEGGTISDSILYWGAQNAFSY